MEFALKFTLAMFVIGILVVTIDEFARQVRKLWEARFMFRVTFSVLVVLAGLFCIYKLAKMPAAKASEAHCENYATNPPVTVCETEFQRCVFIPQIGMIQCHQK